MHALVEIHQPFRDIVQARRILRAGGTIVHAQAGFLQLGVESFAQPRADVQQRQEIRENPARCRAQGRRESGDSRRA